MDQNIVQGLASPDEETRKRAIFLAAQALDFRAVPALRTIAENDPSIELKYFAKKALFFLQQNYLRQQQGQPPMEGAPAPPGGDPAEASDTTASLQRVRAGLEDPDPQARNRLVQALARHGAAEALDLVLERVDKETDPFVRATMAVTVGILGTRREVPVLERFLKDEDPRVRANAIEGLMHVGAPEAARLIAPHLKDLDNRVKVNAYTALGKFERVDLLRALAEMIGSEQVWLRDSATYALVKLELPESVPLLDHALKDEYKGIRLKARNGLVLLAKRGVSTARAVLERYGGERDAPESYLTLEFLDLARAAAAQGAGDDPQGRLEAVLRVVQRQDRSKADALLTQLNSERDPRVLATLLLGLARLGDRRCLGAVAAHLRSPDRRVRANSVEALGVLGGADVQPMLVPFLQDPDNRVRANAVVALKDAQGVELTPVLLGMAQDSTELMRLSAVYALLELRREDLLPLLAQLARDPVPRVRKKALDSLRILGAAGMAAAASALAEASLESAS